MANEEHLEILKRGVEVWNRWREENPDIQPDLIEADLGDAKLSRVNLSGILHDMANLSGADLSDANLTKAGFFDADLSKATLDRANLYKAYLEGANLSGASLIDVILYRADLTEADLTNANLNGAGLGRADLSNAILNLASLRDAMLNGADLSWASLSGADLSGADLSDAGLHGTDLRGADLNMVTMGNTILADVDLSAAKGLENVEHIGPLYIDLYTLYRSSGSIPEVFLRRAGIPSEIINYLGRIKTPECPFTLEQLDEWITNLKKRLTIISRNLDDRKEVKALHGPLNAPLSLNNEIRGLEQEQENIEAQIVEYQRLRTLYYP